jgi:hypothetical protein
MRRLSPMSVLLLLAAVLLVAVPVSAQAVFQVTLDNGSVFESRYQPQEAAWNPQMVLMMTEGGNWIALPREQIVQVTSDIEVRGIGRMIDAATIDLGWAPNDAPVPEEEDAATSQLRMLQQLIEQQGQQQNYDVEQFVSPGRAGQTGGLPLGYATGGISVGSPVIVP